MPGFQAIVFDVDGTLLDSLADIAAAANRSLDSMGFPGHSVAAYTLFVGDGIQVLARRILPEGHRDAATVETWLRRQRAFYRRSWRHHTRPYPGVPELLEELTGRGVQLAVLSNKPQDFLQIQMEECFPRASFTDLLGARDGIPLKPDPQALRDLMAFRNWRPERVIMVGDTGVDMQTAAAAGTHALGVLWGFRDASELRASGAGALAHEPAEILEMVDGYPRPD